MNESDKCEPNSSWKSEFERRTGHLRLKHLDGAECGESVSCRTCNLFVCAICLGVEGSLPIECPLRELTEQEQSDIYAGKINYAHARWWVAWKQEAFR